MIAGAVAKRYARALADVAAEQQALEPVRGDLAAFASLLREQRELQQFLANPSVLRADTAQVVGEIARRMGASPLAATFLTVLAEAGRYDATDDVRAAMALLERNGIAAVPGHAFYANGAAPGILLRFCFAKDWPVIVEACRRLESA